MTQTTLTLKDGTKVTGRGFGSTNSASGEVVFSTGMVGYPESLTDPSYKGQILVLTYPLIGNYGVPDKSLWESDSIKISGLVVSNYNDTPSHFQSLRTLSQWMSDEGIPGIEYKDTRFLTKLLRDKGSQLGKITTEDDIEYYDPNAHNLVELVSTKTLTFHESLTPNPTHKTVVYIDCGGKQNMVLCLLRRGVNVITVPWNFNPFTTENKTRLNEILKEHKRPEKIHGIVVSNGPGDPKFADKTIETTKEAMRSTLPILGICLGHQILTLAAGGTTEKLKFGHRAQNQPCLLVGSKRCYITTQNHGFAVKTVPTGFKEWFVNANDNSNEGIIHESKPFMSVQFHPEATPGPQDTEWIFDYYIDQIK